MNNQIERDVVIIGASASGLMCALEAGRRGRKVIVLDHASKAGEKIRISGGGRCNFTNYQISADNYISNNRHYCKSALSRFTQWDFIALLNKHKISFHEREHGQLFCDNSAQDILQMLLVECADVGVEILLKSRVNKILFDNKSNLFIVSSEMDSQMDSKVESHAPEIKGQSLVVATGGLSIPKMGATPYGYKIAEQFGHSIEPTRAGLVPLTLHSKDLKRFAPLAGIAVNSIVRVEGVQFRENILFTHRGLSGPAILQISSYWRAGREVVIDLLPEVEKSKLEELITDRRTTHPNSKVRTALSEYLPKRLSPALLGTEFSELTLHQLSKEQIRSVVDQIKSWRIVPNGSEGYRTAEVTVGGVSCDQLSSKTMESTLQPALYFIGEVVDVTGWLGGYNFQWAWSSGWSAGQVV
ncbi:MAG: NAD(P)/FAD-dependent oxidoreductase [Thiotrichales bacterium]|jgi:hypothetical protein|nr:NAD(P)/FAD-dependent oxidoreductase [Thiotrichales bacterium]MBT3614103.1 NAD(P)/FAD-dependent oxidoreductase [Thiotrichales bacterium]MBT3752787.1 NAD(P)/FAD-dependent oxidoreductase [Thiotrichales bacterium]MBT3837554.1 NAD(P)/FAD-dependent oxidoreductase [Thiotrichales bacterium]MBT4152227.1 NAD(P)/FAD-dependent oxidoreductase [Thiotrichales bacterium]